MQLVVFLVLLVMLMSLGKSYVITRSLGHSFSDCLVHSLSRWASTDVKGRRSDFDKNGNRNRIRGSGIGKGKGINSSSLRSSLGDGDRGQRRSWTTRQSGSSYSGSASGSNNENRYFRENSRDSSYENRRYKTEEKKEPVYGHYDGDHVFGIAPVYNALTANRRNITELLIQEGMDVNNKKDDKIAGDIIKIAGTKGIPIREFSRHDLNMMTDNKVHQGFVLRAKPLQFTKMEAMETCNKFSCVLALDEVWDPQNFGALLRTCHFLGIDKVVACSKNSAPLSPTVSKASAGALELMEISSVDNMMKFLDKSAANGWHIVGTALTPDATSIYEIPVGKPTIIVLGNEGHGMRTNIIKRCSQLVKINPSAAISESTVDSLNVSVTGAIILHHVINSNQVTK